MPSAAKWIAYCSLAVLVALYVVGAVKVTGLCVTRCRRWLFLLGWAHIVSGTFSPVEIAMTLIIGVASLTGIVVSLRWRTAVRPLTAAAVAVLFSALQLLAFRLKA